MLLRSQKNELFDIINESELSHSMFELVESSTSNSFIIKTIYDSFYMKIKLQPSTASFKFYIEITPWEESVREAKLSEKTWKNVVYVFSKWIGDLEKELTIPDKWAELEKYTEDFHSEISLKDDGANTQFTFQEVKEIEASTERAKAEVAKLDLLQEQIEQINGKLDYIAGKAQTSSRRDWKNIAVGTIINTIVSLSLPPEASNAIWKIIQAAYDKILLITG